MLRWVMMAAGGAAPPVPFIDGIVMPLTYADTTDLYGAASWERSGGPVPTTAGGEFSSDRAISSTSIPAWVRSESASLYASADIAPGFTHSSGPSIALSIGAGPLHRLALGAMQDPYIAGMSIACVQNYNSGATRTLPQSRPGWRYGGRYPQQTVDVSGVSRQAKPQAFLFTSPTTALVTAHYEEQLSRCHHINVDTGEVLGYFDFGPSRTHIASCTRRESDGSIWFCDYTTGDLISVDVPASLASGSAVVLAAKNIAHSGAGAVAWVNLGGVEYLASQVYTTTASTAAPWLYFFAGSVVDSSTSLTASIAARRCQGPWRCQGIVLHDGELFAIHNSSGKGESQTALAGGVLRVPLPALPSTDYNLTTDPAASSFHGPGRFVEDIDVHPVTGELWTATEGFTATGDDQSWCSFWSSPLLPVPAGKTTLIEAGIDSGVLTTWRDGNVANQLAVTSTEKPTMIRIGAPTGAALPVQWLSGFVGAIKNVVVSQVRPSVAQREALAAGSLDTRTLFEYSVTLVNPGAEDGLTGWTNEIGGIVTRATSPTPHSGARYFSGGSVAQSKARQSVTLASLGVSDTEIDAGRCWVSVGFWQAGSSSDGVPGDRAACGVRTKDDAGTVILETMAQDVYMTPTDVWVYRSLSVALTPGTRSVDVLQFMNRAAGTVLQGNIDDITMTVFRK